MSEHRKASRRSLGDDALITIEAKGRQIVAKALDVSHEGMRIRVPEFLEIGTEVFCEIDIYQDIPSFYVKGAVVRVFKDKDQWEAGVKFDIVRVYNFFDEKNNENGSLDKH